MCWKLFITVVVPAPDEPVTAMMGCRWDMAAASDLRGAEYGALVEQRRDVGLVGPGVVVQVIALDALDFFVGAQDRRRALLDFLRDDVEQRTASGPGAA